MRFRVDSNRVTDRVTGLCGPTRPPMIRPMSYLVLGASNLWFIQRPFRRALARATTVPCALHLGPGRAYCVQAGFLFLSYPPLLSVPDPPDLASVLLMDLGSDLVYNVTEKRFRDEVFARVRDWRRRGVRVAVVPVFERTVLSLGPRLFLLLRTIFFKGSRLELNYLKASLKEFNRELRAMAAADPGIVLVEGLDEHVGPDRIHFVRWKPVIERLVAALVG